MRRWAAVLATSVLATSVLAASVLAQAAMAADRLPGQADVPQVMLPAGAPRATVALISGAGGWSADEARIAARLGDAGALVIAIDLPRYLAALERSGDACVYLVADIERASQGGQRAAGGGVYHAPIVAGAGAGGGLALAIAAQTPPTTIGRTIAVDPTAAVALRKPLCTEAPRRTDPAGAVYGLQRGDLPDPITVAFTQSAPAGGRSHVEDLRAQGFGVAVQDVDEAASAALETALADLVAAEPPAGQGVADVPLVELAATPAHDAMAVIYSGDGGWRDLDRTIGRILQARGVPVVGVDSLRYFWSAKTPEGTAADLARLIALYTDRWKVGSVIVIGYSFGADILPATYAALDPGSRERIAEVTLLGFGATAPFEISVGGWIGAGPGSGRPTLPDALRIDPALLQCVYGREETDSACPALRDHGAELIETAGGHHFDGDYKALASRILDGLERRLARSAR